MSFFRSFVMMMGLFPVVFSLAMNSIETNVRFMMVVGKNSKSQQYHTCQI